jgi:hypothetical protein
MAARSCYVQQFSRKMALSGSFLVDNCQRDRTGNIGHRHIFTSDVMNTLVVVGVLFKSG